MPERNGISEIYFETLRNYFACDKVSMSGFAGLRDATSNREKVDYWRENNPHANMAHHRASRCCTASGARRPA
jgi:hypothetical protein